MIGVPDAGDVVRYFISRPGLEALEALLDALPSRREEIQRVKVERIRLERTEEHIGYIRLVDDVPEHQSCHQS